MIIQSNFKHNCNFLGTKHDPLEGLGPMFTFLVVITIVCSLMGSVCVIFCILSTIEKVQKRKAKEKKKEVERLRQENEKGMVQNSKCTIFKIAFWTWFI